MNLMEVNDELLLNVDLSQGSLATREDAPKFEPYT